MSAVASADAVSVIDPIPGPTLVAASGPSIQEIHAAEQKRWMIWFGLPALVAAVFVGAVFATDDAWYIGLAIAAIIVDIFILVWLAMSSDTNGLIGEPSPH
jgi:hypothetical protein